MSSSGRYFLVLLFVALAVTKVSAADQLAVSEINLRFTKLLDSAQRGDIAKQVQVAEGYLIGYGVKQDAQLAAEWYERAANAGDPSAQNQIGYMYQAGLGVPKDLQRAARWYQLSATNGSLPGKVNLAVAYIWGVGVPRNPSLGAALLEEASRKGSGVAAAYLGDLYLTGCGVAPDKDKAVAWLERGVKLHSYYAEYKMGIILSKPEDHPQDRARSIALLRSSVAQGYVPAMYAVGLIAVNHPESNIPHEEALSLLRTASDAGSWRASAVLAVLERDGKWVPGSNEDAYRYFKRAALQGGEGVTQYVSNDLQVLSARLAQPTVAALSEEASEWAKNHPVALELIHKGNSKVSPFGEYALASPAPGEHTASGILSSISD